MSENPEELVRLLQDEVDSAWRTYHENRRYHEPRYDIGGLRLLAQRATALAAAIEQHGIPPAVPSPANQEDLRLARQAHLWAKGLANRADMILDGRGDVLIQAAISGKPHSLHQPFGCQPAELPKPVSIRSWVTRMVALLELSDIQVRMNKQHRAEHVVQMKTDLLLCFDYCKRLYNTRKPRKPRASANADTLAAYRAGRAAAKAMASAAFDRLLPFAIPFPLTEEIQQVATAELGTVLCDRGEHHHKRPIEAAIPVIMAVVKKYLRHRVTEEFVRQGASFFAGAKARPGWVLSALAAEEDDPDYRYRALVDANHRRIAQISEPTPSPTTTRAETDP